MFGFLGFSVNVIDYSCIAVARLHSSSNHSLLSGFGWYLTVSSAASVAYFIRFYSSSI
jgi:hypothetical protein